MRDSARESVGIKDVAALSGVSPSTVSRTLTGSARVDEKTRRRVLQAVKELNYKPSMAARNLKVGESRLIGLIIPDIENPYYPQIVKTLEDYALQAGYTLILCSARRDAQRERAFFETFRHLLVDGILYVPSTDDVEAARECAETIPMVVINRSVDIPAPCINICNEDAAYQGVHYLIQNGHRKIGLCMNNSKQQYNPERLSGCLKAFREAGIEDYRRYWIRDLGDEDDVYARVKIRLLEPDPPTAFFLFNDYMALSVYRAVIDCGLRIPGEISVMGFDDIPTARYMAPPLSTVRHATYDTLKVIFDNLKRQIDTREFGKGSITYYKAKLVIRDSVRDITGE